MEELFDSLKNWGCDVDGALARFIGDRELYRSCLHTAGDQNFELLPEALRAGEMGRAFECAHTLKGMLANMGLIPLYDIVVRIVEPLRAGEPAELLPVCDKLLAARQAEYPVKGVGMRVLMTNIIALCDEGCMRNFCGMFRQRDRRKLHAAGSGRIA